MDFVLKLPALESPDIEEQARAVLAIVLVPAAEVDAVEPVLADPATCPNCGVRTESIRTPYCSETCREIAGFIRQVRSGLSDGTLEDRDRQIALGQVLWRILGGGLPLRNHLIKPKELARLFAKFEGRCAACGQPATTVDHIGSHCNRTTNLRPMCEDCAVTKPFGSPVVLDRAETKDLVRTLSVRIGNELPIRPCDDATTWDWRAFLRERKVSFGG